MTDEVYRDLKNHFGDFDTTEFLEYPSSYSFNR
jgi:hypothetical protein